MGLVVPNIMPIEKRYMGQKSTISRDQTLSNHMSRRNELLHSLFFIMSFLIFAFICCDLGASANVGAASTSPLALQIFLRRRDCLLPDIVLPCPFRSAKRTCIRLLYSEKILCTDVMQST